jgi:hypothetical protein
VDSITISGNTLTTTGVNQDLILNANGTGIIRIENLNFQPETADTPEPDDSCGNETVIINYPHI